MGWIIDLLGVIVQTLSKSKAKPADNVAPPVSSPEPTAPVNTVQPPAPQPAPAPEPSSNVGSSGRLSVQQLEQIIGRKSALATRFVSHLGDAFSQFNILSPLQRAHFLAQVLHESGDLRYTEELASGDAYEGRKDLGNMESGDGRRFKGRGLIQITGRSNYRAVGSFLGIDLLTEFTRLAEPELATISAGWFWMNKRLQGKNLNEIAERDDALLITYLVNGGMNGLQDRLAHLKRAYAALGVTDGDDRIRNHVALVESHVKSANTTSGLIKAVKRAFKDQAAVDALKNSLGI